MPIQRATLFFVLILKLLASAVLAGEPEKFESQLWTMDEKIASERARTEKKPILILFNPIGTWCPPCNVAREYMESAQARKLSESFVLYFCPTADDGKPLPPLAARYGINSVPTVMIADDMLRIFAGANSSILVSADATMKVLADSGPADKVRLREEDRVEKENRIKETEELLQKIPRLRERHARLFTNSKQLDNFERASVLNSTLRQIFSEVSLENGEPWSLISYVDPLLELARLDPKNVEGFLHPAVHTLLHSCQRVNREECQRILKELEPLLPNPSDRLSCATLRADLHMGVEYLNAMQAYAAEKKIPSLEAAEEDEVLKEVLPAYEAALERARDALNKLKASCTKTYLPKE